LNLEDVLDPEYGLKEDTWSLKRESFGVDGQLQVVGWSGYQGKKKLYILKCSKCAEDEELFGQGFFKSKRSNLQSLNQIPCGCSSRVAWSSHQYEVLCRRKACELEYTFLGFQEWKGAFTKIEMSCDEHGIWVTGTISSLLHRRSGCPTCKEDKFKLTRGVNRPLKSDKVMIESFTRTGAYDEGTVFWRSDRVASNGVKAYWYVSCPICSQIGEARSGHLQLGAVVCGCSVSAQKQAYINLLILDGTPFAIKFGIAKDAKRRLKAQNEKSIYDIVNNSIYIFPSVKQCKRAERECKEEFECGVVLKRDMGDGYTETTWLYNLEKIKEIYEKNGGVPIE